MVLFSFIMKIQGQAEEFRFNHKNKLQYSCSLKHCKDVVKNLDMLSIIVLLTCSELYALPLAGISSVDMAILTFGESLDSNK